MYRRWGHRGISVAWSQGVAGLTAGWTGRLHSAPPRPPHMKDSGHRILDQTAIVQLSASTHPEKRLVPAAVSRLPRHKAPASWSLVNGQLKRHIRCAPFTRKKTPPSRLASCHTPYLLYESYHSNYAAPYNTEQLFQEVINQCPKKSLWDNNHCSLTEPVALALCQQQYVAT